jgi:hypothetical protein
MPAERLEEVTREFDAGKQLLGVASLRLPKLNRIAFGIVQMSKSSVWIKLLINVYSDASGA